MELEGFNVKCKCLIITFVVALVTSGTGLADNTRFASDKMVIALVASDVALEAVQKERDVVNNCTAYFEGTLDINDCRVGEVPQQAAIWLFVLALFAFVGLSNKRKI